MRLPRKTLALACSLASFELAVAQDTTRVSVDSSGAQGNYHSDTLYSLNSISADGMLVCFSSIASNLIAGDKNATADVFVHDRSTGTIERVSVDSAGGEANGSNYTATISPDGRFVVFQSTATNLVAGDTNGAMDVFLHDRTTGVTERVSVDSTGAQGNGDSGIVPPVGVSADGETVVFTSRASNLVSGDTNGTYDVFVHDRSTGITERMSVDSAGNQSKGASCAAISADGKVVAFYSGSDNLIANDTNGLFDAFVHDRTTGITERVSVDSYGAQGDKGSLSYLIALSADGSIVVFVSAATNLVAGDTNGKLDVFLHDRTTGSTERVSVDSSGVEGNANSFNAVISADKRFVVFTSAASNLVPNDTNNFQDVFLHDRTTGITERVSVDASGAEANYGGDCAAISADGEVVSFDSGATNLVPGDTNNFVDVFVRDRCDAYWSSYGAGFAGTNGTPTLTTQADPVLGTTVAIDLSNSAGASTLALLFVGYQRAQIPTSAGGDLLVDPVLTLLVSLPAGGGSLSDDLPDDDALCGFKVDLQAIEIDAGAMKRISFTAGLELVLGR